ncbi:MAG: S-layer homology domain-containing protein, partial [Clostridiales bacterium]|nr:S-layer homology domain-containing protein [Clostridiales bacterium]
MVTYLSIGEAAAERLSAVKNVFDDVADNHWANKYIAYAKEVGILSGDGDGNYRPEDALKGSEVAKLMNTVLGYGKTGEYEGPSWEIHAISDGVSRGLITNDREIDLTAPATREEVIQYVFNTLRPGGANYLVEYSSIIGNYVEAGTIGFATQSPPKYIGFERFGLVVNPFDNASGYPVHNWRVGANIVTGTYPDAPATYRSTNGTIIYNSTPGRTAGDLESIHN